MPDWSAEATRWLAGARLAPADEADIAEELAQHLEERYQGLLSGGVTESEAIRLTMAELDGERAGGLMRDLAAARRHPHSPPVPLGATSGGGRLGRLWGDLRFGARLLRRTPGFTIVAALTLALGIGANTTIFSIINALLLRPLDGVARPGELVQVGRTQAGQGFDTFSWPDYLDFRDGARTLSGVAGRFIAPAHLSTGGASERVRVDLVSGNYFQVLGIPTGHGRLLLPDDDGAPGAHPVAVLSDALWRRRFGSDPGVIGATVRLNGHPFTIIGVTAGRFHGTDTGGLTDLFVPMAMLGTLRPEAATFLTRREAVWLTIFGRLAPGATVAQAQAEIGAIARHLQQQFPETNAERGVTVAGGLGFEPGTRGEIRTFSGILLGVVGLVLLIACANVANLLLARGAARAREMAVRASLGASRGRLVSQLLAEGLVLAALGGAGGFVLGVWSLRLVLRLPVFATGGGLTIDAGPDPLVLAFTAGAMLLSGVLFALPPAFRASRVDLVTALKLGAPGAGGGRSRLRGALVVAQLALSLVLLVASGLYVRTLAALYRVEPGFDPERVLVATVDVGLQGYDDARARTFFDELERRVAALPGVERASLGYMLPLGGGGWDTRAFPAERAAAPDDPGIKSDVNVVSPDYFATVGMPVVRGRGFDGTDRAGAPLVAVVNEALAGKLWPGADPVGRRFRLGAQGTEVLEVVGVVRTARYRSLLEAPRSFFYRPFAQLPQSDMTLHVRVGESVDPGTFVPAVRRVVADLDGDLPLDRVQTLAGRLDRSVGSQRTAATLVALYGLLALALAAVGLYGSMAYLVSRRTREIGVRMALGAEASRIRRQVLGAALRIAALGGVIGLAVAVPAGRLLRSQLFGVTPADPVTLVAVVIVLGAVSLAAAYVPARRATRVDPVVALQSE